ncbi:GGDEF domain-containing protein [Mycolicibacterium arabiense]|uniref:GGDEF domain-containing protein n=1 Tax=Mycolicibacterium arabiense TaxID=1286181 RepID=UPI0013D246B3|nr:GGDEF domain-containing protein [Mycolicibacterium arabiense]MCV7372149.1 GGDEF domain-containing protein [Mycolicibacterium arabiense]
MNRSSLRSDRYYWLTSLLTERGLQTLTRRVMATVIVALGAPPLLTLASPIGPAQPLGRGLAAAVTLSCLGMALIWLRRRWPTRAESLACVIVGTLCVSVASLVTSSAQTGLLGAISFAVITVYVVAFHSARLLWFTWPVAAAVLVALASRLAAADVIMAIVSVVLVVAVTVFAAAMTWVAVRIAKSHTTAGEIEPLTGLPHKRGMQSRVATLLAARSRDDDRYFVLVLLSIDGYSLITSMGGQRATDRARTTTAHIMRDTVRRDAIIAHTSEAEFVVVDVFATRDASPLVRRIHHAVAAAPQRLTVSVGVVCTPLAPLRSLPPGEVVDEIVTLATAAMYDSRRTGGQRRPVRDRAQTRGAEPAAEPPRHVLTNSVETPDWWSHVHAASLAGILDSRGRAGRRRWWRPGTRFAMWFSGSVSRSTRRRTRR